MHFHADSCQHSFPIVRSELPFVNAISFITRRAQYAIGKNQKNPRQGEISSQLVLLSR